MYKVQPVHIFCTLNYHNLLFLQALNINPNMTESVCWEVKVDGARGFPDKLGLWCSHYLKPYLTPKSPSFEGPI